MAAQRGKALLLKIDVSGTMTTVGGMRSTSMTLNDEAVDITNKDSGSFRELLPAGGIQSMSISASGVFTDSTGENNLRGAAFTGSAVNYDLVFGDGSDVKGAFIVTSYERAGEFNGEETFSCTLESSGTITYTNA